MTGVKLAGLLLLFLTGGLCGIRFAAALRTQAERAVTLRALLADMAAVLRYQSPTVWELTAYLAAQPRYRTFAFLGVTETDGRFHVAWTAAVERESALQPEERALLAELGEVLGTTDTDGQLSQLLLFQTRADVLVTQAQARYETKGKLYRTLGLLGGAAAAVLLA